MSFHNDPSKVEIAARMVKELEHDISDRRGLKHEWNRIDADVKQEIRKTWTDLVLKALDDRDTEWQRALSTEFKVGGAISVEDDKWVQEKATYPERWARIVRLVTVPPDVKLHGYKPVLVDIVESLKPKAKRDLSEVMKRIRPLLEQGGGDLAEFDNIASSVAFAPPEGDGLNWRRLCELLEDTLPEPKPNAPAWVREIADIVAAKK